MIKQLQMFDRSIQQLTQKPLSFIGKFLLKVFNPNQITFIGFFFGIMMCFFIFIQSYFLAILFLLLNRFCDGLDGVMARQTSPPPRGAYIVHGPRKDGSYPNGACGDV